MFRRQNEDFNPADISAQGSLLAEKETVSVLSPQQAAAYQSQQPAVPQPSAPMPSQPASSGFASAARPNTISAPSSFRPASLSEPKRAEPAKPSAPTSTASSYNPAAYAPAAKDAKRVLTVGPDILMKGEINSCDRLVIEGKVDATVNEVHIMELAEGGSFKGTASVEYAEISGLFEGDLTVKSRLIIYASGKVRGKVTYGEIEIERGGELTGEVKTIQGANQAAASTRTRVKEAA